MPSIAIPKANWCFHKHAFVNFGVVEVKRSRRDAAGASSGTSSSAKDSSSPFVVVDEIGELSPAAEDGLQLGDQILEFGNLERGENLLLRLAAEVRQKQGEAVPLVVMKQGSLVNVTVTPRTWLGHGLLGYVLFSCSLTLLFILFGIIPRSLTSSCIKNDIFILPQHLLETTYR